MLTRRDLKYELKKALKQLDEIASDDGAIKALKICAKLLMLCIKLVLNTRDNQTTIMKHLGIELRKDEQNDEER